MLFDDLSFYGPDKLHSRRTMTVWELEARRDRKYFKKLLETGGRARDCRKRCWTAWRAKRIRPRPGVQMVRGRATNVDPEREVSFAFLHFPDAPIEAGSGMARIRGQ